MKKQRIFIAIGMDRDSNILIEELCISSFEEAKKIFMDKYNTNPIHILGPFLKEKTKMTHEIKNIKFSPDKKIRKAIYNGWSVNTFTLIEPVDYLYLVFLNQVDDAVKNVIKPTGTTIVPVADVRFLDE